MMVTALTRRAALATTARAALAVAAGSGVAVAVLPDDDQALRALAADLRAALAAREAAGAVSSAASDRYYAVARERPAELPKSAELREEIRKVTIGEIADGKSKRRALQEYDERNAAHIAAWKAECDQLADEYGLRTAEDEFDARVSAVSDLALRIAQAPAATLAGVRIKLSLKDADLLGINGEQGETLAEDLVISIAADLDRWASV
jgi:hypothetical protein